MPVIFLAYTSFHSWPFFFYSCLCKLAISVKQKKRKVAKPFCKAFPMRFAYFFFKKFVCKTTVKLIDNENIFKKVFTFYFLFIL